jgi:serine/threonine-protein kinase SRK2
MREGATDRIFAIKAIKRPIPIPFLELLKREVEIQANIGEGHLNIVNLHEMILTETHLAIVQEYAERGCLTDYLSDRNENNEDSSGRTRWLYLSEDEALYFFRQFISAVEFCHKNKIVHRDL